MAEHQRKMAFPFSEKSRARIKIARDIFLWCCRAERGGGGAIHLSKILKIGSDLVE